MAEPREVADHSCLGESGRAARKLTTIAKVIVMYIGRPLLSDRSGRPARRLATLTSDLDLYRHCA